MQVSLMHFITGEHWIWFNSNSRNNRSNFL